MDNIFYFVSFFAGGFVGFLVSFALAEDLALDRERAANSRIEAIARGKIGGEK